MPVLPLPFASSVSFSLFSAAVNLYALGGSGAGRVRDLRIIRLARRVADQLDWNLLASAPAWVHPERSLRSIGDVALLFAVAATATFCVLFPIAVAVSFAARRLPRGSAIAVSIVSMAALGLATGGLLSPMMNAVVCSLAALLVFVAFSLLTSSSQWLSRSATAGLAIAIVACALAPLAKGQRESVRHAARAGAPNILLISIDSLRADHLHAYGYPRRTSPNIDSLAADGALFETVISPTSWTLPAHMTLMTSLAPEEHGVITNRLRLGSNVDTLPMRLQRSGYTTAGFVSATYLDGIYGFSRGFDEYDDYTLLRVAGEKSRAAVTSRDVAQRAIGFLNRHAAARDARPFFLFLHFFDVHYNYNPPQPYARMFDSAYTGRATGDVDSIHQGMASRDLHHDVALYDGEIAWVDANIGSILDTLRRHGIEDNTIIAITADHGEEFLEHGQAAHYKTLYDEVLRVPLVVRYPGHVFSGRRVQGQVRLMDVAPTLLTLARLPAAKPRSGNQARSLACLITSPGPPRAAPLLPAFGDLRGEVASVRTGGAKLIRNLRTHREEFYDLVSDPGERTNLDALPKTQRDQLRVILDRWRSTATANPSNAQADLDEEEKATLRSLGYMQ
ncbi:MAG: sulfatase [Acidobacteria bacterium]|nr:sulfatase [Acidobacteriota bacterium]